MHLITALITLLFTQSVFSLWKSTPDISKFYSNNSVILTVGTTMTGSDACKIDYVNETTTTNTTFRRVYDSNSNSRYEDLLGQFTNMERTMNSPPYDGMVLRLQSGGSNTSIEQLLDEFGNYICGIFLVYPLNMLGNFYELRVKLPHRNASQDCMNKFVKVTGGANNKTCKMVTQY